MNMYFICDMHNKSSRTNDRVCFVSDLPTGCTAFITADDEDENTLDYPQCKTCGDGYALKANKQSCRSKYIFAV